MNCGGGGRCGGSAARLPTLPASDGHNVSAMLRRTDKRARPSPTHTRIAHTHARTSYLQFLYEHFFNGRSAYPGSWFRSGGSFDPPSSSSLARLYLPPLALYVILPLLSLISLPVHFLIGAAARRCCCAAERRGRCRAGCKQERSAAPGGRSVGGMRAVVVK